MELERSINPRVEALLRRAHELSLSRTDQAPTSSLRGEVDLNSLSREGLEVFLKERGLVAPPGYSLGDLVTLAKQAKFFTKKTPPADTTSSGSFTLAPRPSRITGAGTGVFLQGAASKGTVVAFYPGCVYAESDLPLVYPYVYQDNDYLAYRPDRMLIDANSKDSSRQAFVSAWAREHPRQPPPAGETLDFVKLFANPFALGHLVNHPPPDVQQNVISVPFDFHEGDLAEDLHPHVPNVYFLPPRSPAADGRRLIKSGMVLVAARDLQDGEELLMNYHYNSRGTNLPSWYRPPGSAPAQ